MKTKLILLSTFLIFSCYFARGQSEIDTSQLLNKIHEGQVTMDSIISYELALGHPLKIELYGKENCLLTKEIEQMFLPILERRKNDLTFQLFYLDHSPPNKKTLLQNGEWQKVKTDQPIFDPDIINSPTVLINGVEFLDYIYTFQEEGSSTDENCCTFPKCFSNCTGLSYSAVALSIISCAASCAGCVGSEGTIPPLCIACGTCLEIEVIGGTTCALYCAQDPCYSTPRCRPGDSPSNPAYDCSTGIRRVQVCNCEGTAYDDWAPAPCPEGSSYNSNCQCAGPCFQGFDLMEEEQTLINTECTNTILIDSEINHESIPDAQDGSISVHASNGFPSYTYTWSDGGTGANRPQLSAGEYCVTVSDIRCCASSQCFTIVTEACEDLEWNIQLMTVAACNEDDGGASVEVLSGGLSPYTYLWSNGESESSIESLETGGYFITITDANGCTTTDLAIVSGANSEYPPEINGIVTNICSDGSSNSGAINLFVSSTTEIVSYTWSNGETSQNIDNLPLGSYGVIVQDECENEFTADFIVSNIFTNSSSTPASNGVCDGSITVSMTNGIAPYSYEINGPGTSTSLQLNSPALTFGSLCAGDFTISITDNTGCTITFVETVVGCPEPVFGSWYYNVSSQQFCRPFNSPGNSVCPAEDGELCFTPIYGGWVKTGDEYCRTVTCPEGAYCDGFNISGLSPECFTPIYGNWYWQQEWGGYCKDISCTGQYFCENLEILPECGFGELNNCTLINNNEECQCEIWANGEFTGFYDDSPAGITHEYINGACIISYFCNGEAIYTETPSPEIIYTYEIDDDYNVECTEKVYCDEEIVEETATSVDVEFDYDEDDNKCLLIFSCGDEDYTLEYEPDDYGDWEFDAEELQCKRAVICFDREDDDWIDKNEDPEIHWEYDGSCSAEVNCDGGLTDLGVPTNTDIDYTLEGTPPTECITTITCSLEENSGETYVYVETDESEREYIGYEGSAGDYLCKYLYSCGSEEELSELGAFGPFPNGDGTCTWQCVFGEEFIVDCFNGPTDDRNSNSRDKEYKSSDLSIKPNPFREEIQIAGLPTDLDKLNIDLINNQGQLIQSSFSKDNENIILNTTKTPTGIYFIKIYNKEYSFFEVRRVVKF